MEFDEKELRKEISYAIKNIHGIRHVCPLNPSISPPPKPPPLWGHLYRGRGGHIIRKALHSSSQSLALRMTDDVTRRGQKRRFEIKSPWDLGVFFVCLYMLLSSWRCG